MNFREFVRNRIVVFDGAFGTVLQSKTGGKTGTVPEKLNLSAPELIAEIHREYAAAGADVITANTFGANEIKTGSRELADELIRAGVRLARREAGNKFVALDIGPLGRILEPMGDLPFGRAYDAFAHAVEAGKDADLILIETMSDLQELRAALLAAREHSSLPVICSMTFDGSGRTFMGCDPVCYALTASPLADAVGVNCSQGPEQLLPVVRTLLRHTDKPVIVQANAGLPDEKMHYDVDADEFARACETFVREGVRIIGGCCGTTPEYIRKLRRIADRRAPQKTTYAPVSAVCSASRAVLLDGVKIIGERINPTGKKAMKQALLAGDYDFVQEQASEQAEAGADILDVNAGLPELDEAAALERLVREVQAVCPLPLQIDTGNPEAAERALRVYCGKAILNSVNGEEKTLRALLPVAKKYGAAVVGLTIDERGLPKTAARRVEIAEKIIRTAERYGIPQEDIFIDCLTLTASAEQDQASETLNAIRIIKEKYRVKTILGVSNISFGLPNRKIINTAFLTAALFAGLDLPILNPNVSENMQAVAAFNVLSGRDRNCAAYSEKYGNVRIETKETAAPALHAAPVREEASDVSLAEQLQNGICKGLPTASKLCAELLQREAPLDVIENRLIPALNKVGDDYESGKIFLPQLIAAAESAKGCFAEIKKLLPEGKAERGKIVMATVKGDMHDIGKNIVKTVLENYGYTILDLGRNVPPEKIAAVCREEKIALCGLSALMTTTVVFMEETIRLLRRECPACRVMVGGAVLTADYAKKIGADYYCKDANASVKAAQEVFGK